MTSALLVLCVVLGLFLVVAISGIAPVYPLVSRQQRVQSNADGPFKIETATTVIATPNLTAISPVLDPVLDLGKWYFNDNVNPPQRLTAIAAGGASATMGGNATAGGSAIGVLFSATGLNGRNVRLYSSAFSPTVQTLLSQLTAIEATFDGYAPIPLQMAATYIDGSFVPTARSQLVSWLMLTAATTNTVYGYWVDDGVNVLMAQSFAAPVPMAAIGAELAITVQDSFPPVNGTIQVIP